VDEVTVLAPAKINLVLLAGGPRPDGYHPLLTVFQAVGLYERVTLRSSSKPGISVSLAGRDADRVPLDSANLAVRAVQAVADHIGMVPAVDVHIEKSVPVAAGLAGGSADAAAALVAANRLWRAGLEDATLHQLAAQLGSDVNFCLTGGTAIGRGRGEQLEPIAHQGPPLNWVLVVRPGDGLATAQVFAALDQSRAGQAVKLPNHLPPGLISALQAGDAVSVGRYLANDLAASAMAARPGIASTLRAAQQAGALGAVVTGSGPTVAALANDPADAARLAEVLADVWAGVTGLVGANRTNEPIVVTGPAPGPLSCTAA